MQKLETCQEKMFSRDGGEDIFILWLEAEAPSAFSSYSAMVGKHWRWQRRQRRTSAMAAAATLTSYISEGSSGDGSSGGAIFDATSTDGIRGSASGYARLVLCLIKRVYGPPLKFGELRRGLVKGRLPGAEGCNGVVDVLDVRQMNGRWPIDEDGNKFPYVWRDAPLNTRKLYTRDIVR